MYQLALTYGITQTEADATCIGLVIFLVLMGTLIQYVQSNPAPWEE